jgi:hypothetical protein
VRKHSDNEAEQQKEEAYIVRKATKGAQGMPGHQVPKKDAVDCEKPRGAVSRRYHSGISEWGNPAELILGHPWLNT